MDKRDYRELHNDFILAVESSTVSPHRNFTENLNRSALVSSIALLQTRVISCRKVFVESFRNTHIYWKRAFSFKSHTVSANATKQGQSGAARVNEFCCLFLRVLYKWRASASSAILQFFERKNRPLAVLVNIRCRKKVFIHVRLVTVFQV